MRDKKIILAIFLAMLLVAAGCRGQGSSGISPVEDVGGGDGFGDKREGILDACALDPADLDNDGICNAADDDDDGDGIVDDADGLPLVRSGFATLSITSFEGEHIIDKTETAHNEQGMLTGITDFEMNDDGTSYQEEVRTFSYESGHISREEIRRWDSTSGALVLHKTRRYTAEAGRLTCEEYNPENVLIKKTIFIVEGGNRIFEEYDGSGNPLYRYAFSLTPQGSVDAVVAARGVEWARTCNGDFEYFSDGKPSEISWSGDCTSLFFMINLEWRADDSDPNKFNIYGSGTGPSVSYQKYDADGRVIEEKFGGNISTYTYDDFGNVGEIHVTDRDGVTSRVVVEYTHVPLDELNYPVELVKNKLASYMLGIGASPMVHTSSYIP